MNAHRTHRVAAVLVACLLPAAAFAGPLRVVTTEPTLADLARSVGGDEVSVRSLAVGPQDPHFVEPRPSFVRALHEADLFLQIGMELEIGWAPVLLRSARNSRVQPGAPGFLDASTGVAALEVPSGRVDRSKGDVHPYGNPHYLADPVAGLRVAQRIARRLAELRPEREKAFRERSDAFTIELLNALLGTKLVARHDPEALSRQLEAGQLDRFLESHGDADALGGWLGRARRAAGTRAVQDHRLWPYFARRFGLELVNTLEPKPGIAPTTRHLTQVVERMRSQGVGLILSSPYFDPRHARWVAERTGARIAQMAHQVGAREGTDSYLAMIAHNVRETLGSR